MRNAFCHWLKISALSRSLAPSLPPTTATPSYVEAAAAFTRATVGADVLDVVEIGSHVRRIYAVIRLERGPLYGFFECYQTPDGSWIVPMLLFNSKAQDILPARYLGG